MKVVSTSLARSIWFVPIEEMNPHGLDLIPVYASIQARYRFQQFPPKPDDFYPAPNGVQFGRGSFRLEDGQSVEIFNFSIYTDGFIAETRHSTSVTDQFLSDVLTFASANYRLVYDPASVRRRAYVSEIVITSDLELDAALGKLRSFAEVLSRYSVSTFTTVGIRFGVDPAISGSASTVHLRASSRQSI